MVPERSSAPVEIGNVVDYVLQLRVLELRIDGQCDGVLGGTLRFGKLSASVAEVRKALLQMQRHRIVDLRPHPCCHQMLAQRIAIADPQHVLVVNMAARDDACWSLHGTPEISARKCRVIEGGVSLPGRGPAIKIGELHVEHGGLQLIDAEITADQWVVILGLAAMYAQDVELLTKRPIVRDAH